TSRVVVVRQRTEGLRPKSDVGMQFEGSVERDGHCVERSVDAAHAVDRDLLHEELVVDEVTGLGRFGELVRRHRGTFHVWSLTSVHKRSGDGSKGFLVKTKAAILWEIGKEWSVEEIELDPPKDGEVLVTLAASGMCHSDEHLVTGDLPFALPIIGGHE